MHRAPSYFSDTLPGQGRRPPLDVTLHAEDDTLVLAVCTANGHAALKNPPGPATVEDLLSMLKAEVGTCRLGDWEAFAEVDGARAGWMTTVRGRGVADVVSRLEEG